MPSEYFLSVRRDCLDRNVVCRSGAPQPVRLMRLWIGFTPKKTWKQSAHIACNSEAPGLQKRILTEAAC
jgi:hypothetical protein